jgi:acyl-CoA reductase-like NAD-dependent aldehyde dehydrogenase
VHSSIYPQFLAELVDHVQSLPVGDGFKENVFMGPIQNAMQYERVKEFLADAEKQNHKMALKGGQLPSSHADKGYFFKPTIIDNPPDDSRIVAEEPFGKKPSRDGRPSLIANCCMK